MDLEEWPWDYLVYSYPDMAAFIAINLLITDADTIVEHDDNLAISSALLPKT